ncbi:MAG: sulfatase/phosphatase domain-containing protein [Pirellulaceae bacterium]
MKYLLSILLTLGILLGLTGPASAADEKRPNILFIMSDDHAYQAISAYGSVVNKTPNLDRIARDGMRFDRCYVTNSICGPSRAVILTGKYSHLNGFVRNGNTFNGKQQTVAKLLQKVGYETAVVGKWHLKSDPTGFDYWHVLVGQGPYYNPPMKTPEGVVKHTGYTTDIITDQALDYLKNKRDKEKPFFLMYQHKAPHRNWQPGPKYLNKYDDVTIPEPATLYDDYSGRGSAASGQAMTIERHLSPNDLKLVPQRGLTDKQKEVWHKAYDPKNKVFSDAKLEGRALTKWKYQRYVKDYLRCIDSVDENVGRVLDYLDESGLAENTVVFYTSDQGWYLGEHGWYDKRWMYEESFRTPLMVRWPGVTKPGSVDRHLAMNLDFAQTFLQIAGAEIPGDMQGRGLKPILAQEAPADWRKSIYYHYYEFPGAHSVQKHYGVRTDRYKLINFYELEEWELFDLEKDPHELLSVYSDPAYEKTIKELEAELERLREQYKDDGTVVDSGTQQAANVKQQLVKRFNFADPESDLTGGTVVPGHKGHALELTGKGTVYKADSSNPRNPALKPIVLGGWVYPQKETGVILAQGGEGQGYSLYLQAGAPVFAVRSSGALKQLVGPKIPLEKWTHLVVVLAADGTGTLYLDGKPAGKPAKLHLVSSQPADNLNLGADAGSLVGDYDNPLPFVGKLEDVRLYWGTLRPKLIPAWSKPPGE